ncbi:DUF4837 domain-containing protein [Hanstruepera neustonica]|uniref:DUF4837 domain-containing protein n=1 Tax=Hanstruepera neustonica TaxID=1445657 RepID=A0A2K1E3D8_9FLAO|nr:DUF4837 family protein [Hanstruepera neustonica]PNQ74798.1 DUF4837 domain-containing protein [Hanstruepera neustonica]
MRKILFVIMVLVMVVSCQDGNKKNIKLLSESSGNINNLSVVVDHELWEGNVGEAIRDVFAAPVHGLNQDEPLFILSQIPPSVFSGFATRSRIVLKIEKGDQADVKIAKNVFAKPQRLIVVMGKTNEDIINQIHDNAQRMVESFKNEEIKERQRRTKQSLHKNNDIKEKLGIDIEFPSVYRIAKEDNNFYWIRKDITTGTTNLMLYELSYGSIVENDSLINQIIKIRDSVGQVHIPGPVDGSYMATENAYTPFLSKTQIDDKEAFETKGLWDVKNAFMSGPFVNYIINDPENNRQLVVEGFAFAPSVEKRDYMFELESIIKSIKFK